jgi:hypothetical protein
MYVLSEEEIRSLLAEPKAIPTDLRPLRHMSERHQHKRKDFSIIGESGHEFVIAIRQSNLNVLDFSVILGYKLPGSYTVFRLRRYNGSSHRHTNTLERQTITGAHIHTATERYQMPGFKEEHFAEATARYATIDGAIQCLLSDCGFKDTEAAPLFTGRPK